MQSILEMALEARRAASGIPVRWRSVRLASYDQADGNAEVYAQVRAYVAQLHQNRAEGRGMLLVGDPGLGKSLLASIILNEAMDRRYWGHFDKLAKYLKAMQNNMGQPSPAEAVRFKRMAGEAVDEHQPAFTFLVIDDVGKEYTSGSGWTIDEFDLLLRTRYDLGLPTILTSNVPVPKWAAVYSPAMRSFIMEACPPVRVTGQDYRMMQFARANAGG